VTCDHPMTVVSLFDGIGGFPLAFSSVGAETVATVEIDKAAAGVTADHFPNAKHFADVTEVTPDDLIAAGFCSLCGVVTGGWPCQDLSLAGRRLGLGGARSGLFFEIVRIARGLRPRWLVLENVPGLLSAVCSCPGLGVCGGSEGKRGYYGAKRARYECTDPHPVRGGACGPGRCMELHGGAMGAVLGALAELGYGFAYRVLDAQHFGVPQRRRRVVIVASLGDGAAPAQILLEPKGVHRDSASGRASGSVVAALTANGVGGGGGPDDNSAQGGHVIAMPLTAREGKGPDSEMTSGNVVATVTAKWASGRGGPAGDEVQNLVSTLGGQTTHALTSEGADASEDGTGRGTPIITHTLTAGDGAATEDGRGGGNPIVGFDLAQITSGVNRSNPQPGDPQTPLAATGQPHVAYALRRDPGGTGQGHNTNYVPEPDASVRRLTPVECERLQGYPDGWTATSNGKPQADSARYRQLGNSIAVPVFAWVARRLVAHHS
jgi:DNA (cytosine-5)-methyltransferase 1